MSNRGRGRGGGAKPNDRSSTSSSAASSRNSSLTRPATTPAIDDSERLMKQLVNKLNANPVNVPSPGASARPTAKFAPNLVAAKKEKDKTDSPAHPPAVSVNSDPTSTNRRGNSNGFRPNVPRGHRGGHGRGNYVQTEGFFQGNSQIPVGQGGSSSFSRGYGGKGDSSGPGSKMLNIKKPIQRKTTIIGDVDGLKYEIDEEYEPRQIPISERKSVFDVKKEPGVMAKVKEPTAASTEHIDSFVQLFAQQKLQSAPQSIVKDEPVEPMDTPKPDESLADPSQLILMQFPDVLPCPRPSSSTTTDQPALASLSDLPDGFLGKLQIFRSGKCRLKLSDDTYLDVDIGQPTSFLQNVMVTEMASASANSNEHSASSEMNKLVCLGDIKHKLIVSLDVDHVLQDTRQQ